MSLKILAELNKEKATKMVYLLAIVGLLLFFSPDTLLSRLGSVLLTSGLVSLIYNVTLRRTFLQEVHNQLKETIQESSFFQEVHYQVKKAVQESFIKDNDSQKVYKEFPLHRVNEGISSAKSYIWIFTTWFPSHEGLVEKIPKAIENGCKDIRILLLCPTSDLAKYRSKDLGFKDNYVNRQIKTSLEVLEKLCRDHRISNEVDIRLYKNTTPTLVFFAYDDTIIFSPYFKKEGLKGPGIEVKGEKSILVEELKNHFNKVWEVDAFPIDKCLNSLNKETECYDNCKNLSS